MSLGDLCRAIDWSSATQVYQEWMKDKPTVDLGDTSESIFKYRCALLESALMATEEDTMRSARGMLAMAGVWDQVVQICEKQGLLPQVAFEGVTNSP